jgi:hypothetical protein
VERDERVLVQVVVAGVLGPVPEVGAVRPDRRGDDGATRGLACDPHARSQHLGGGLAVEPAACEALERRLIARRDRDIGAGGDVRGVHLADEVGRLEEDARRPQRVADVRTAAFQLGPHRAVDHGDAAVGEQGRERVRDHAGSLASRTRRSRVACRSAEAQHPRGRRS